MLCDIAQKSGSLAQFAKTMSLESPETDHESLVTLSTIHSAKGLEWDRVVLIDAIDEVFPGDSREDDPELARQEKEEMRRCLYVAVTRARERLVLCQPNLFHQRGQVVRSTACRYLRGVRR